MLVMQYDRVESWSQSQSVQFDWCQQWLVIESVWVAMIINLRYDYKVWYIIMV